jgi:hypothetical protein
VDFDVTGQLLIYIPHLSKKKKKLEYNEAVLQLIIDFKKVYGSVRREVLCNIIIEFDIPMKLVGLIKIYLMCG